jgi:hypothetical protein
MWNEFNSFGNIKTIGQSRHNETKLLTLMEPFLWVKILTIIEGRVHVPFLTNVV